MPLLHRPLAIDLPSNWTSAHRQQQNSCEICCFLLSFLIAWFRCTDPSNLLNPKRIKVNFVFISYLSHHLSKEGHSFIEAFVTIWCMCSYVQNLHEILYYEQFMRIQYQLLPLLMIFFETLFLLYNISELTHEHTLLKSTSL